MIKEIRYIFIFILVLSIVFTVETKSDIHLNSIDVENKLGTQISGDIRFSTDQSKEVTLNKYFACTGVRFNFVHKNIPAI